jgi:hypothetical protein
MIDDPFLEIERELGVSMSAPDEGKVTPIHSRDRLVQEEGGRLDSIPLIAELIGRVKDALSATKDFARLSQGRFSDREFGDYFNRVLGGDLDRVDLVLSGLLNYIKVNTPIQKKNTVHTLVEELLKAHQPKLEEKGVRLFKKFEKDLPETIVPDEQLRYILDSLFRFAAEAVLSNGSIGISTKSLAVQPERAVMSPAFDKSGRSVQIIMVFKAATKPAGPVETGSGSRTLRKEDWLDLELRMVREIVQKNQGSMKIETDAKESRTVLVLRFPAERRRVVCYRAVNQ